MLCFAAAAAAAFARVARVVSIAGTQCFLFLLVVNLKMRAIWVPANCVCVFDSLESRHITIVIIKHATKCLSLSRNKINPNNCDLLLLCACRLLIFIHHTQFNSKLCPPWGESSNDAQVTITKLFYAMVSYFKPPALQTLKTNTHTREILFFFSEKSGATKMRKKKKKKKNKTRAQKKTIDFFAWHRFSFIAPLTAHFIAFVDAAAVGYKKRERNLAPLILTFASSCSWSSF